MRIYLLRHGETADNAAARYTGAGDAVLTERGRAQMATAAGLLSGADIRSVWCSPSPRALQSAALALPDVPARQDERLRERDMGIFESLTYSQIAERYPEQCAAWQQDWAGFEIHGGESYHAFYERVAGFWRELLAQEGGDVLLSTHGGVLRASYCFVMGDPLLFWKFACRNGDVAAVHYEYGNLYLGSIWPGEPAGKEIP